MPDQPTCDEIQDLLHLHACGELEPELDAVVVDHLRGCPECRKALEEHKALNEVLPGGFAQRKFFYHSIDA